MGFKYFFSFLIFLSVNSIRGQLKLVFDMQPLPNAFYDLNITGNSDFNLDSKYPKSVREKSIKEQNVELNINRYTREGVYLVNYQENEGSLVREELSVELVGSRILINEMIDTGSKVKYYIDLERKGRLIVKDLYKSSDHQFYSGLYDSDTKKILSYYFMRGKEDTIHEYKFKYSFDTTYVDYVGGFFETERISIRFYEENDVLHIDYFDERGKINYLTEYFIEGEFYVPKLAIVPINGNDTVYTNELRHQPYIDSILFSQQIMGKRIEKWLVFKKDSQGNIIYRKNSTQSLYKDEIEFYYDYYQIGKRNGLLKKELVKLNNEEIFRKRIRVKLYWRDENPILNWEQENRK